MTILILESLSIMFRSDPRLHFLKVFIKYTKIIR